MATGRDSPAGDACRPGPPGNGRCPFCGHPLEEVVVHGHVQCARCGMNLVPCCNGETAAPLPAGEPDLAAIHPPPPARTPTGDADAPDRRRDDRTDSSPA